MKRNFVLMSVVLCSAFVSQAQIKKGAVLLGGNIGFATQTYSPANQSSQISKQTNLSLSPAFGKAVRDNLIVGGDVSFDYSNTGYDVAPGDQNNIQYGAGVFVRKYKYLGNNFYLFGQGRLGASIYSNDTWYFAGQNPQSGKVKGYSATAGFYPGVSYAVTNKLQLETGFNNLVYINFSHNKGSNQFNGPSDYKSNSFSLGSSLSNFSNFTLGVRFLLNKQG